MKKPITEYDNTPPRDTPATESQSLVAKWMAPRAVRDNGADESPSRLLSGVMFNVIPTLGHVDTTGKPGPEGRKSSQRE